MKAVLHIGSPKTGSTTIQRLLRANRDALRLSGVFSVAGDEVLRDIGMGKATNFPPPPECDTFIYSDEKLMSCASDRDGVKRVVGALSRFSDQIEILCYARRQDEMFVSAYLTRVLGGETSRFSEVPLKPFFNLRERLDLWAAEAGVVALRRYGPGYLKGGDILEDFIDAMGWTCFGLKRPPDGNVSPTVDILELLRLLNVPLAGKKNRRGVMKQLLEIRGDGPRLGLSREKRKVIALARKDDEDDAARRYLGEDVLFTHPFKDDETHDPNLSPTEVVTLVERVTEYRGTKINRPSYLPSTEAAVEWAAETLTAG